MSNWVKLDENEVVVAWVQAKAEQPGMQRTIYGPEVMGKVYVSQDSVEDPAPKVDPQSGIGLTAAKERVTARIYAKAKSVMDRAWGEYSEGERYIWAELEKQARALNGGGTERDAPLVIAEASSVKVPARAYAQYIINKADALYKKRQEVVAKRYAAKEQVQAMTTAKQVLAFDVDSAFGGE